MTKGQTDWDRLAREEAAGIEPEKDPDEGEFDWCRAQLKMPYKTSKQIDEEAIGIFTTAMQDKMAKKRKEGRTGWWNRRSCQNVRLARMLAEHLLRPNDSTFVDVANICMMLHQRKTPPIVVVNAIVATTLIFVSRRMKLKSGQGQAV